MASGEKREGTQGSRGPSLGEPGGGPARQGWQWGAGEEEEGEAKGRGDGSEAPHPWGPWTARGDCLNPRGASEDSDFCNGGFWSWECSPVSVHRSLDFTKKNMSGGKWAPPFSHGNPRFGEPAGDGQLPAARPWEFAEAARPSEPRGPFYCGSSLEEQKAGEAGPECACPVPRDIPWSLLHGIGRGGEQSLERRHGRLRGWSLPGQELRCQQGTGTMRIGVACGPR